MLFDLGLLAATFRGLGLAVLAEPHRLTVTAPDDTSIDLSVRGGFVTLEWKCGKISLARKLVAVSDPKATASIKAFVVAHAVRSASEKGISRTV
jgi:hypothetical protein